MDQFSNNLSNNLSKAQNNKFVGIPDVTLNVKEGSSTLNTAKTHIGSDIHTHKKMVHNKVFVLLAAGNAYLTAIKLCQLENLY